MFFGRSAPTFDARSHHGRPEGREDRGLPRQARHEGRHRGEEVQDAPTSTMTGTRNTTGLRSRRSSTAAREEHRKAELRTPSTGGARARGPRRTVTDVCPRSSFSPTSGPTWRPRRRFRQCRARLLGGEKGIRKPGTFGCSSELRFSRGVRSEITRDRVCTDAVGQLRGNQLASPTEVRRRLAACTGARGEASSGPATSSPFPTSARSEVAHDACTIWRALRRKRRGLP